MGTQLSLSPLHTFIIFPNLVGFCKAEGFPLPNLFTCKHNLKFPNLRFWFIYYYYFLFFEPTCGIESLQPTPLIPSFISLYSPILKLFYCSGTYVTRNHTINLALYFKSPQPSSSLSLSLSFFSFPPFSLFQFIIKN